MKKVVYVLMLFVVAIGLASCKAEQTTAKPTPVPTEASTPQAPTPEETPAPELNKEATITSHYPVAIENFNFAKQPIELTFNKTPERVLAVYQSSIETLLALGLSDKIVAASGLDFDVKPEWKDAFSKVKYLTEFEPNKETAISLEPDFILSWNYLFSEEALGDVADWNKKGVNTYMARNSGAVTPRTLENEYIDILNIGKIFDVEDKAQAIVDEIKTEVERVVTLANNGGEKKKVLVMESQEKDIRVYGPDTLGGDMVAKLGGDVVGVEGKTIGNEDLIKLNPDVIFVVYFGASDDIADAESAMKKITENPIYAHLLAVENKTIYPIALGEMYCSGVRTIDGIHTLSKGMYPNLK